MLNTSVYCIDVKEIDEGHHLIAHGYTGAIDVVSSGIFGFLHDRGKKYFHDISIETITNLRQRGYLTDMSPSAERSYVAGLAGRLKKIESGRKSFFLLVAYDCNFRCTYCFEKSLSASGTAWSRECLTEKLVDDAFCAMASLNEDTANRATTVTLYGGEPFLSANENIIRYICSTGSSAGFTFTCITNGYEIDKFSDLLTPDLITGVQITLDGTEDTHNRRRIHRLGHGTFRKILSNIRLALECGVRVDVRLNIDRLNFAELRSLVQVFSSENLLEHPLLHMYSTILQGCGDEASCHGSRSVNSISAGTTIPTGDASECRRGMEPDLSFMPRSSFVRMYIQELKKYPELHHIDCLDVSVKDRIAAAGRTGPKKFIPFRSTYCGAQNGMYIFDPSGSIYTCLELVGKREYTVGSYDGGLILFEPELKKWTGKNVSSVEGCNACPYALYCGGGCTAHLLESGKRPDMPNCEGFGGIFKNAVEEYYRELSEKR